jgi:tRNA-specific 2-thiouridylase
LFADRESIPGDFVDSDGTVLGRHRGIEHYTVGQRKGLGVAAGRPLYVARIDAGANRVVLADDADLLARSLRASDWVWAGGIEPGGSFQGRVKIRSNTPAAAATVSPEGGGFWNIAFDEPVRAIAPGQSAVVYLGDIVFGGGTIQ